MKSIIAIFLMFLVLVGICFAAEELIKPKELTTTEVQLYVDWNAVVVEADKATEAKEYDKASELYIKYSDIGDKLNRMDLKAWGLNNAGYMLIKKHAGDKWEAKDLFKDDYEKAKKLLNKCIETKGAKEETIKKAKKNIKHINERLGIDEDK